MILDTFEELFFKTLTNLKIIPSDNDSSELVLVGYFEVS
jgi:hypothetical protein